jgi:hypothetical protein
MKLRFFSISFFLFFSPLTASAQGRTPQFVSLGSHCEVSDYLRATGLRNVAMPFDWLLSFNHEGFIATLSDDFLYLTDDRYLLREIEDPSIIQNFAYKVEFRHDWPHSDYWVDQARSAEQLKAIKTKYKRRVVRFKKLNDCEEKVVFIRAAYDFSINPRPFWREPGIEKITTSQAREIRHALKSYFPKVDFTLVIVNYVEENSEEIENLEGVREFKIRKSNKPEDYRAIFSYFTGQ